MTTNAMSQHYGTLSGQERFTLMIEAMARGDRAEERRLHDSCPMLHYRAEDEQYRGRMRRLGTLALIVAMELRERLAVLRLASAFGTHGAEMCRLTFGPLMQAAYLAGRDRGRREAGAPQLPEADRYSIAVVTAVPDLRRDLMEVAECVSLGTDQIAEVVREAAGEEHAAEVLTKWEGFGRFCRDTLGLEALTVMRAWGLLDDDPVEVVRQVCADARADEVQAEERSAALSRRWVERFG